MEYEKEIIYFQSLIVESDVQQDSIQLNPELQKSVHVQQKKGEHTFMEHPG